MSEITTTGSVPKVSSSTVINRPSCGVAPRTSNNPSLIKSEEILGAYEKAKQAGKVNHLGLSTHQNAQKVLEAAMEGDDAAELRAAVDELSGLTYKMTENLYAELGADDGGE